MSKVLIITDNKYSDILITKIISLAVKQNHYDIVTISKKLGKNYQDNSYCKLHMNFYHIHFLSNKFKNLINKTYYQQVIINLNSKSAIKDCINTIRETHDRVKIYFLNSAKLNKNDPFSHLENDHIISIRVHEIISNKLLSTIPNIPVFAENVGLEKREILEVSIPRESGFIYKHLSSIKQNNFSIAAIYRDKKLLLPNPSLMIRPNDNLLLIGTPHILANVHRAINNIQNPFSDYDSIYLFIDIAKLNNNEIFRLIKRSIYFFYKMSLKQLIIRIINPFNMDKLAKIKRIAQRYIELRIDYTDKTNILSDIKQSSTSLVITHYKSFQKYKKIFFQSKIPLFCLKNYGRIENLFILLNHHNIIHYESISSTAFHLSNQLAVIINIYSFDPNIAYNQEKRQDKIELLEHYQMLANIFKQKITVIKAQKNPIIAIKESNEVGLQILPFNTTIMYANKFKAPFTKDSDALYYKLNHIDRLLLPV